MNFALVLLDAVPAVGTDLPSWVYKVVIGFLVSLLGWSLQEQIRANKKEVAALKGEFALMKDVTLKEQEKLLTELRIGHSQVEVRLRVAEQDINNTVSLDVFNERSDSQDNTLNATLKAVKALDARKVSYGEMPAARAPAPPPPDSRREPVEDSNPPAPMRGRQASAPGYTRR